MILLSLKDFYTGIVVRAHDRMQIVIIMVEVGAVGAI
jgi:hypothetical protein